MAKRMVIVREIRSPENKPQKMKRFYNMKEWSHGHDFVKTYHILFFSLSSLFLPPIDLFAINRESSRSPPRA